jgi:hypothetical protein
MCPLLFVYLCVLCLIVVPLPPGKLPFAVQLNTTTTTASTVYLSRTILVNRSIVTHMLFPVNLELSF